MGTDVHATFQQHTDAGWEDVPSDWEQNRHYLLFAWLADVRNGYGFAGVPTHSVVKPISPQRGLPDDVTYDEDDDEFRFGDHSFSWLTADEILNAARPVTLWRTGVITREQFDVWDGAAQPNGWCGGISGGGVCLAESPTDVTDESTHVRVWWREQDDGLDYFVDEVRRLKELYGEVRLVFGFDS